MHLPVSLLKDIFKGASAFSSASLLKGLVHSLLSSTCWAQKQKCDDGEQVGRFNCTLRLINCYGYDAKPDWMDGGNLKGRWVGDFQDKAWACCWQRQFGIFRASSAPCHHLVTSGVNPDLQRETSLLLETVRMVWTHGRTLWFLENLDAGLLLAVVR